MRMGCRQSKDGKSIYEKESLEAEHEGAINCMGLSEDGSLLVTGSDDWTARMWSTQTDDTECLGVLEGHENSVTCVALSDTFVITGSSDTTIRKWDMTRCECIFIYEGHTARINRLICTGEFIFSASSDRTSRAWIYDTDALSQINDAKACIKTFKGHRHGIHALIFLSGDAHGSSDTDDERDEELVADDTVTIHPGDRLITGSMDTTAKSWNVDTGQLIHTFRGHKGPIVCMTTDEDAETLFTAGEDHAIKIWDISNGMLIRTMDGHADAILCMQVVKKLLYTGSKDKTARCWVTAFGENTRTYQKSQHSVSCLKVANGVVFTGSGDTHARAYDAKSGALKRTYTGHGSAISCLQWINHKLYTGSNDGVLKVWDARDIADDPVVNESDSDSEEDEDMKELNKENKVRLRELERRLENVGTTDDEIKQMEDTMAGIQDYD
ncbi:WD repeat-containing protein 86-like isoform X2 [Amphibalanus amphitrite]|uniref:WD repeat-containing protein 86-like isoform X2 n=1 Tax=Amphibalanus amphitrite TaxID=1232801 RepID=UPI001C91777E|nr:WD repeat-containing protein 86-like isoform X2 [Amphibalanus amphitrite]